MYGQMTYGSHSAFVQVGARSREALYQKASFRGWLARAWVLLSGRSNDMLDIHAIVGDRPISSRRYAGTHSVPLSQIQGSESRKNDFDRDFNPIARHVKERWINIARLRVSGRDLPVVDLIQIENVFIVRDGHHRVSVARALQETFIDANVTVWELPG